MMKSLQQDVVCLVAGKYPITQLVERHLTMSQVEGAIITPSHSDITVEHKYGAVVREEILQLLYQWSKAVGPGGLGMFYTSNNISVEASQDVDVYPALMALTVDPLNPSRHNILSGVARDSKLALEVNRP
ncbi:hypothetical protein SeMB42_g05844 [Synchytrium endobioticum]|uniref:Uncharacterized protein n=1 Tax=Synchytrium endobioticum TaxID=286115 RepID=A0A507CNZ8_9FUNG|nr:hypothetical protein SeMB42_g05844 [Synchytrium endobioticum]